MTTRFVLATLLIGFCFSACAFVEARRAWDPAVATTDAERDIAAGQIKFCYVGGRAPHAPGVPEGAFRRISPYPRIAVGPQDCLQDERFPSRAEYARRYNVRMWKHLTRTR